MPFVLDPKTGEYRYRGKFGEELEALDAPAAPVELEDPAQAAGAGSPFFGPGFTKFTQQIHKDLLPADPKAPLISLVGAPEQAPIPSVGNAALDAVISGADRFIGAPLKREMAAFSEAAQPYVDPANDELGRQIMIANRGENFFDPAERAKVDTSRAQQFSAQAAGALRAIPTVIENELPPAVASGLLHVPGMEDQIKGAPLAVGEERAAGAEVAAPTTYAGHGVQQVADYAFSMPLDPGMASYAVAAKVMKNTTKSLEVAQKLVGAGVVGAPEKLQAALKAQRIAEQVDLFSGAASLPGMVQAGASEAEAAMASYQQEGGVGPATFGHALGVAAPALMSGFVAADMARATKGGFTQVPTLEGIHEAALAHNLEQPLQEVDPIAEATVNAEQGNLVERMAPLPYEEPVELIPLPGEPGSPEYEINERASINAYLGKISEPDPYANVVLERPTGVMDRDFVGEPEVFEDAAEQERLAAEQEQRAAYRADLAAQQAELDARIAARYGAPPAEPQGPRMVITPEEAAAQPVQPGELLLPPGVERPAPAPPVAPAPAAEAPAPFRGRVTLEDDFGRAIEEAAAEPPGRPRLVEEPVRMSPDARAALYRTPLEEPPAVAPEAPAPPSPEAAAPPPPPDGVADRPIVQQPPEGAKSAPKSLKWNDTIRIPALQETNAARGTPIMQDILTDLKGVWTRSLRSLDQSIASGRYTMEDVAKLWQGTRNAIRAKYGDTVTLWRADAPQEEHIPGVRTLYFGNERLAKMFEAESEGARVARPYTVPVEDILAVNVREDGKMFEIIVRRPESGIVAQDAAPAATAQAPASASTTGSAPAAILARAVRSLPDPAADSFAGAALWNAYSQQAREVGKTASLSEFRKAVSESGLQVEPDGTYIQKEGAATPASATTAVSPSRVDEAPAAPSQDLDSFRTAIDGLVAEDVLSGASAPESEVRKLLSKVLPGEKFDTAVASLISEGDLQRIGSTVGFTPQGITKLKAGESAFDEAVDSPPENTPVGSFTTRAQVRVRATGEKALKRLNKRRASRGGKVFDISSVLAEGGKDAADITIWGASQLLQRGMDFPRWSKKMVAEFGKKITPYLEKLFIKGHEYLKWQQELYRPLRKKPADRVNHALRGVVARYAQRYDLDIDPRTHTYAQFDATRAKKIADAYEAMAHNPNDPRVHASYQALLEETGQQWDFLVEEGYTLEPWTREGQPYQNSNEMRKDVRENKHLYFFTGGDMPADHPLAAQSGRTAGGQSLTYNDVFRAIHDTFAHAKEGFEFGQFGEEAAWNEHYMMFTPQARPAMTTETRGQNSWVNFGRHLRTDWGKVPQRGEPGFVEPEKRPYAQQKAGLLPEEFVSQQVPRRKVVEPEKLRKLRVSAKEGKKISVRDVGEALQTYTQKRWGAFAGKDLDKAFERAVKIGREEISFQLEQKKTGVQWYTKDIADMEEGVKQIHPDLADPDRMSLFKAVVAASSFGNKPNPNLEFALEIWDGFNKTGKFPARAKSGNEFGGLPTFGGLTQARPEITSSRAKLQKLVDTKGVAGAAEWLRTEHTLADIRATFPELAALLPGKPDELHLGARVLGPKGGPFLGNLHGIHENLTADLWFSRTWHRWMGTLLDPQTPTGLKGAPSSEGERVQMGRAIERLAEEFGLTTADTQAVLWYYEKQLYGALGARMDEGSYAAAVKLALAKRAEPVQQGLFDDAAGVLGEADEGAGGAPVEGRQDAEPGGGPASKSGGRSEDEVGAPSQRRILTVGRSVAEGNVVDIAGSGGAHIFVQTAEGYPHDWIASLAATPQIARVTKLAASVFDTINQYANTDSVFQGLFASPGFNGVHVTDRRGKNIYLNIVQMAETAKDELASWIPLTGRPGILAENIVHTLIHETIHNKLPHDYSNGDVVFLEAQARLFDQLVEQGVVDQLVDSTLAELTANNNRLYSWLTQKAAEGKVLHAAQRNARRTDAPVRDAGVRGREAAGGGPAGAAVQAAPGPARGARPEGAVPEGGGGETGGVESPATARGIAGSIAAFRRGTGAAGAGTVAGGGQGAASSAPTLGGNSPTVGGGTVPVGPSSPVARPIPPSKEFVFHPRGKDLKQGVPRLSPAATTEVGTAFQNTQIPPTVGKPSPKRGETETDINVSRISTDPQIRDAVARLVESQPDYFGKVEGGARGAVRDWDYVRRQAIKLGLDPNTVLRNFHRKAGALSDIEVEQATIISEEVARRAMERIERMRALTAAGKVVEADTEQILFEADMNTQGALRFTILGARAEAARVLALANKLGSGLTNEERSYRSFVNLHKTMGPNFQREFYDAITRGDWKRVNKLQEKAFDPTYMQKVLEMWKAGLLSGPKSHIVNFISTGAHVAGTQPLEAFSAGLIDAVRAKVKGIPDAQRERFMGEGVAMLRGAHAALGPALFDPQVGLIQALRDIRDGNFEAKETARAVAEGEELYGRRAIGGVAGERIRTPFQLLTAADNFWKVIAESQYIYREAFRDGRRRSLSSHALEGHVKGFIDSYTAGNHPQQDALHLGAKQAAKVGTFQEDMPRVIRNLAEAENDWPILGFVFPFKKTPWNIGKAALARTPLGFIPAALAHRKGDTAGAIDAGARAAFGTAMMAALYLLADEMEEQDEFGITGGGPADFRLLQNLRDTGWQPYSVWRKGSDGKKTYLSFQRLDPISSLMGMVADARETRKEEGSKAVLTKAVMTVQENVTNKTFLAGLMGASRALNDPQRYFSEWFQQFESSAMPFSGFLGSIAMGVDPHVRKTDTALPTSTPPYLPPALAARIPFVSLLLPPKKTVVGENVQRVGGSGVAGGLQRALNPFPISTERSGALADVQREFSRIGYVPSLPSKQLKLAGGRSIELSEAEYERYLLAYNDAGQRLSKMIRSSYWKNLPDTDDIAPPGSPSKESETRKLYTEAKKRSRAALYQDPVFRRRAARAQRGLEP